MPTVNPVFLLYQLLNCQGSIWSSVINLTVSTYYNRCTFFQAETHLVFPKSASVEQLKLIRESIAAERDQRLRGGQPVQPSTQAAAASASASAPESSAAASSQPVTSPPPQPSSLVNVPVLQAAIVIEHVWLTSEYQYHAIDLVMTARHLIPTYTDCSVFWSNSY